MTTSNNHAAIKKHLRNQALSIRDSLPLEAISAEISQRLTAWPVFLACQRVLFYYPVRQELDFIPLCHAFPSKQWFLPKIIHGNTLEFHRYHASVELAHNDWGIPEPVSAVDSEVLTSQDLNSSLDLIIVPGLQFDAQGYRLGYGKGFYDRFLQPVYERQERCVTVGAVPQALLSNELPRDAWDLPVDWLVTEENLWQVSSMY